jgi:hypothetical protein
MAKSELNFAEPQVIENDMGGQGVLYLATCPECGFTARTMVPVHQGDKAGKDHDEQGEHILRDEFKDGCPNCHHKF